MKIGILTQPLHKNYGGLLQAYALQQVLIHLGHDVYTIDIPFRKTPLMKLRGKISLFVRKHVMREKNTHPGKGEVSVITQYTDRFIRENIKLTEHIPLVEDIDRLQKYAFEAYIVGSDQVWRPKYSPGIPTYFLDFLKEKDEFIKLSYSASFGTSDWEFSPTLTDKCKALIQHFDAVSVREDSAAELCKKYFGVEPEIHLDPTLLLNKEHYLDLISKQPIPDKKNSLMQYVLDKSPDKLQFIEEVKRELGEVEVNSVMPKKISDEEIKSIEECVYPPVEQWIKGFLDAKFVITDSFHGTIFSILFNKPFISIANESRGVTRFTSVLKQFGLENRLILPGMTPKISHIVQEAIDFEPVNELLNKERVKAIQYFKKYLK